MIASTQTNSPLVGSTPRGVRQDSTLQLAVARLKAAGLRVTRPRMAILNQLCHRQQPASIEQIHADIGSQTCDLVTVYRCMSAFERIGVVARAFFHNGTALYRVAVGRSCRYHVVCRATRSVEELDFETSTELRQAIELVQEKLRAKGYHDVTHLVEFFGVAPHPRKAAATVPPVA